MCGWVEAMEGKASQWVDSCGLKHGQTDEWTDMGTNELGELTVPTSSPPYLLVTGNYCEYESV